jgi:hypothetical protein
MSLVSFIFAPMNIIDFVAIVPYYLDLILAAARQRGENASSPGSARSRPMRLIVRACRLWAAPGLVAAPLGAAPLGAPPPPHMLQRAASKAADSAAFFSQAKVSVSVEALSLLRVVRLTRVVRIFKMSKNFQGLIVLGRTLYRSLTAITLLLT